MNGVNIDWTILVFCAVGLFWPPLLPRKLRQRIDSSQRPLLVKPVDLWKLDSNWFDLARAFLGCYLLVELGVTNNTDIGGSSGKVLIIQMGFLLLSVLFQCIRFRKRFLLMGPVFYLCGLTLALAPWSVALTAILAGWLVSFSLKSVIWFFFIFLAALAITGFISKMVLMNLALNLSVAFFPLGLAFILQKNFYYAVPYPLAGQTGSN